MRNLFYLLLLLLLFPTVVSAEVNLTRSSDPLSPSTVLLDIAVNNYDEDINCGGLKFWGVQAIENKTGKRFSATPRFVSSAILSQKFSLDLPKGDFEELTFICSDDGENEAFQLGSIENDLAGDQIIFSTPIDITPATLHVITLVVNGNGGSAVASDFSVRVQEAGVDVPGSPAQGNAAPGTIYSLSPGGYTISQDSIPPYTSTFTGDCDAAGSVTLIAGEDKVCTVVNTDIPPPVSPAMGEEVIVPLISIENVPETLALTESGLVTYNYTVANVGGLQALTDVSVTDDHCSPVAFLSGDVNEDGKLDSSETWRYSCSATLAETTTNTAVVTALSDDPIQETAIATAISVVIVGEPVPGLPDAGSSPLIDIVKVPSRLSPFGAGGGSVTYTYTITNPGVVPVTEIEVKDDKCTPLVYSAGDTNGDSQLDPTEEWLYSCETHVSVSTRNVAMVKGNANGTIALGYAFASVLVTEPGLIDSGTLILIGIMIILVIIILKLNKYRKSLATLILLSSFITQMFFAQIAYAGTLVCAVRTSACNGGEVEIFEMQNTTNSHAGLPFSATGATPAGYWKMDENTGTSAADASGNANTGTLNGTPAWAAGKFGSAVDFDGTDDYMSVSDSSSLSITGDLTVSSWIYPQATTAATQFTIAGKWDKDNKSYLLAQYGDEIRFYVGSASNYKTTDAANLVTNTWYYVSAVYTASTQTVSIYINGTAHAGTTTGTIPASIADSPNGFYIGAEMSEESVDSSLDLTVSASSDDAIINDSSYNGSGSSIFLGGVGTSPNTNYGMGFRFQNVTIPNGSTVSTAYLTLVVSSATWIGVNCRMTAIDEDNTATFSSGSPPGSRPITSSYIADEVQSINRTAGASYQWPDDTTRKTTLGNALETVFARAGWASGNAVAVVCNSDQDAGASAYENFGRENYRTYDYGTPSANAPKLHIDYTYLDAAPANFYNGILDETRVYNYARSGAQVLEDMSPGYNNIVCCGGVTGLGNSCSGTFATVLKLSGTTNAHVRQNSLADYASATNACMSVPTGGTITVGYQATDCTGFDTTLASMIGTTNSHVGNGAWAAGTTKVCATGADVPAGALTTDIVDSGGTPVTSPSIAMGAVNPSFTFQTVTGTFGEANQKIRVSNTTANPLWSLTIAADPAALWSAGTPKYDFNDSTGSAVDGGDGDAFGGQMTIDVTGGTLGGTCSATGVTQGASASFVEGGPNSITLLSSGSGADTGCYWDLTGVDISQSLPAEQASGSYSIDMTLTITAN